jgi:hypothetical protein
MMMKAAKKSRVLGLVLLAVFWSGCSTWQPAFPPGVIPIEEAENEKSLIYPGAFVRINLESGPTIKGTVARVDDQALYLDQSGNYGYEELRIGWIEVASIEVQKPTGTSNVLLITTGVVLGLGMVVLIGLSNTHWPSD